MQIAFHVGVYGTDEDKLIRCLAANQGLLRRAGVELPQNAINEPIISEALNALKGGTASPEMEEVVMDALIEHDSTRRIVISRPNLLGAPRRVLEGGALMAGARQQLRALAQLAPQAEVEFFLALKNPATLAPDILNRMTRSTTELESSVTPEQLRWAPALRAILEEAGRRRLVVWCNEDMPLIFPDVACRLAGLPPGEPLKHDNPVAEELLTAAGREALSARLSAIKVKGPARAVARRDATAAVLAEHHRPEALMVSVASGFEWDQATVDWLTEAYDADVAEIAALPGIEFINP